MGEELELVFPRGADTDEQLDDLLGTLDEMYWEAHDSGDWDKVDRYILTYDLGRMNTSLLVGVLSFTFAVRDRLPSREILFERVEKLLRKLAPDRVDRMLKGLR